MTFFDPQRLSYGFVFIPALVIAITINIDNRYCGPYFAIVDVVFNDFGTGYKWSDREILLAFTRRVTYFIGSGMTLHLLGYRLHDIAATFLIAGFLLIWPAFLRPLPVYPDKRDWHILFVWSLYVIGVVAFGTFGATVLSVIRGITGQSPFELIRDDLITSLISGGLATVVTAFRIPLQRSLWQRTYNRRQIDPGKGSENYHENGHDD